MSVINIYIVLIEASWQKFEVNFYRTLLNRKRTNEIECIKVNGRKVTGVQEI